ncbi:MAG: LptA/OstA family protein [Alphaproteobacteria bacterium]
MMFRTFMTALLICATTQAYAALPPAAKKEEPVEISASRSLEWNRRAKTYTARQNAVAKQGNFQLSSDTITARYNDNQGATHIFQMEALNNVIIVSPPYTAYGDKAVYDVAEDRAVLTGQDLRIVTETEKLTAKDKVEFFSKENRMVASGGATAERGTDTLKAEKMEAFFQKNPEGTLKVDRITADGGVTIKTEKETVTGDHGDYNIGTKKAVLTGKVKIYQGASWLEGTRAEIDLKTGISQLFAEGNAETEGRVKGVFYPKAAQ